MQETDFIIQNKDKWEEFEHILESTDKDPERLTDLFIETTDDLSYSRTFYPNRSVRVYLNGISQQTYQAIYRNRVHEKNAVSKFWKEELPEAMWFSRRTLLYSFLLFAGGLFIGIASSIYYPEFARIILGDQYIAMTEANIANGDPMAVYKNQEPLLMFFQIAWNNIKISYGTFVLGILFGIGTIYVVFYNAIMVGAFIYFFIERDLFKESFLAIMLHGTLELSMIVIAGCAGFTLARGLIFPGTYSRSQALIHSARQGIKILIGVTILLIYASVIESFLTRYTDVPDWVRLFIILLSGTLVLGYFVWYPKHRHHKGQIKDPTEEELTESNLDEYDTGIIKTPSQIFSSSFSLLTKNIRSISLISAGMAAMITLIFGIITKGKYHELFDGDSSPISSFLGFLYPWDRYTAFLNFKSYPWLYLFFAALFSIYVVRIFSTSDKAINVGGSISILQIVKSFFILLITGLPLFLEHHFAVLFMILYLPICLLWLYTSNAEAINPFSAFLSTVKLVRGNYLRVLGTFLSLLSIIWICMLFVSSEITNLLIEFIRLNIPRNAAFAEEVGVILYTFLLFAIPIFIFTLWLFGTSLLYYSLKEINGAGTLMNSIDKIGFKKRAYGLEQEA